VAALTLRGLLARKVRVSLTALAVFFGVAMIAGTLMLTASVNRSFDDIFSTAYQRTDVTVRPRSAVEDQFGAESGAALKASLLDRIRSVPGVAKADGSIGDPTITIFNSSGKRIGPPQGGPPHIAFSEQPEPFNPFTYPEGHAPRNGDQVAIDSITAGNEGFQVGQKVTIEGAEPAKKYTISGIAKYGSGIPLAGASLAVFTLPEAQRLTGKQGEFDEIDVKAQPGTSPDQLKADIASVLPPTAQARTGAETAAKDSSDLKSGFSFLSTALLVFAGIALFVGAFLIFNTFSITIAQRTREFGMLRTLGASSRQVLGSVLLEAAVIGLIAAGLGIAGGIGFVELITGLFGALGFDLPSAGLIIGSGTVAIALAVGLIATVGSSLAPALRATRVAPLEAVREGQGVVSPTRKRRRRTVIAGALVIAGAGLVAVGLLATDTIGSALQAMGVGMVLLFIGIAMLSDRLLRPLASLVGWPLERLRGVTGQLARENTLRNPGRTATTAAALMIGVALVSFVGVFAASLKTSFGEALDRAFAGDLAILNTDGFSPIPSGAAQELRHVKGVGVVSPFAAAPGRAEGVSGTLNITGFEPATTGKVVNLDWVDGSNALLKGFSPRDALVESQWADNNGIGVGDSVVLTTPTGTQHTFRVAGTVRDRVGLVLNSVALPLRTLRRDFDARTDVIALLDYAPGADPAATRQRIDRVLETSFPNVESRSQTQLKADQEEQINQLLVLIYALLALSIIVSLFGIVNTLVLTIHERTRELGMLRAIGASKRQMRRLIRYESLITALIGAIIGAVLGLLIAIVAVEALKDKGFVLSIPVILLIAVLVLAGIAGILAAVLPARRAARVNVIEALQYE
jgi:putative ABC transport system permease protein